MTKDYTFIGEFNVIKNYGKGLGDGISMIGETTKRLFSGDAKRNGFRRAKNNVANYFTKKIDVPQPIPPGTTMNLTGGNGTVKKRVLNKSRLLKAGGAVAGVGAIGAGGLYAANKVNPFKKEEPKKRFLGLLS